LPGPSESDEPAAVRVRSTRSAMTEIDEGGAMQSEALPMK
jgi:hypothetical protein